MQYAGGGWCPESKGAPSALTAGENRKLVAEHGLSAFAMDGANQAAWRALSGTVMGYYLFRRDESKKTVGTDPWDLLDDEAVELADEVGG